MIHKILISKIIVPIAMILGVHAPATTTTIVPSNASSTNVFSEPAKIPEAPTLPSFVNVAHAAPLAAPVHLSIPNAKVNAEIIPVGITKDGKLDVPNNYTQVGWYQYGPRPGEMGSSVLDAHVDNGGSIPGPFKHLRNLKMGDEISVRMSDGSLITYRVTLTEVYDTDKFPGEKVFHQNDKKYLKLITCHGTFVRSIDTYNQRLIITAEIAS